MMAKRLISMGKHHHLRDQLTDSGNTLPLGLAQ